jgi:DNA primase
MTFRSESEAHRVGGRSVAVTQPEKVLFPNDGITKRELVAYYERIAPIVLPGFVAKFWEEATQATTSRLS